MGYSRSLLALAFLSVCFADTSPHSQGPTAFFLTKEVNLALSCSVCNLTFGLFHESLQKGRRSVLKKGTEEVDKDLVSVVVEKSMDRSCKKLRKSYALSWSVSENKPANHSFLAHSMIPHHTKGTDTQKQWADEFLQHRCGFLKSKYYLETSLKYADREVPLAGCPIKECKKDDAVEKQGSEPVEKKKEE